MSFGPGPGKGDAGVPVGGTTGQVLTKSSGNDYDVAWAAVNATEVGGVTVTGVPAADQVLTATGPTAADWQNKVDLTNAGTFWSGGLVRAFDTVYTNGTKRRHVTVGYQVIGSGAGQQAQVGYKTTVGGVVVDTGAAFGLTTQSVAETFNGEIYGQFSFWVDPGATYEVTTHVAGGATTPQVEDWQEVDF